MKAKYILFLFAAISLVSCKPNLEEFTPASGNADFSTYVAIGNSMTSGYADGALYRSGQEYSYPNILAAQFKAAGGGDFKLPLMADDNGIGFIGLTPVTKMVMAYVEDCRGDISLAPSLSGIPVNPENMVPIGSEGPYNNLAVPGMRMIHISVPGYAALNPFYGRMVSNPANSVLEEALSVNATFFTLWLGSNDVLGFALAGGEADPVTPPDVFGVAFQGTIDALIATGAKGAVANVPDPNDAAFFNTIPYYGLVLDDQSTVDQLNMAYAPLNAIIKGAGSNDTLAFKLGPNGFVITDSSLPWGLRQANATDKLLLTLPTDSIKCAGWGSQKPISEVFVLDQAEQEIISQAVIDYNLKIAEVIAGKDIALVNSRQILRTISTTGLTADGILFTNEMAVGNAFSLDGLHLTPAANAVIANAFVRAINSKFNANISEVVVSDYPAVTFPDDPL